MQVRDFNANDDWRAFCFKTPELAREWLPKLDLIVEARNPRNYQQVVNKLPLMDFDKEFANDPEQRVIATGLETVDGSECSLEDIIKQVCQVSDGSLSFAASCKCGYLQGNYNEGTVCPKCKSICTTPFSDDVKFGGWLTIPETLPPFLHPSAYRILKAWMGTLFKRRMSILDSLLDPNAQLVGEYAKLGQGMSYFYNNFDDIINFIMNMKGRGVKAKEDELIKEFLNTYRNQLFVRHIPILDQSLHVLTKSGSMSYDDKSAEYILEAWLELDVVIRKLNNHPETNPIKIDKYVWRVYSAWIKYTESIIVPKLAKKEGFIRKSCHGHRNHYTGRGVIAPMFLDAPPEIIRIPWRMAVCIFKHEILNILQNRYGYDVNEACDLHMKGVVGYNQVIDSCLKTLWDESPFIGMPFLMGRNPTLRHGAIQLWFAGYKRDDSDDTVSMSTRALKAPNADFDGDELYLLSIKEMATVMECMYIHPISTLLGGKDGVLDDVVCMTDEEAIAAGGWLLDGLSKPVEEYEKAFNAA